MTRRGPIVAIGAPLFTVAAAVAVVLLALVRPHLSAHWMRSHHGAGGDFSSSPPSTDRPPFQSQVTLAVDGGWITTDTVADALREPFEAWFGEGQVTLGPMPSVGDQLERPTLVIKVHPADVSWTPLHASAAMDVTYIGIDPQQSVDWPPGALATTVNEYPIISDLHQDQFSAR